ncbi:MAG: lipoate--protein ligase [Lachnospiraceae bacterium]|nr:lipoate--protein ligase [Lachnospiraceae bacterium]
MIKTLSVWISRTTDPYENLATEEFLTFHTQPDECVLFLWQNAHSVVIGRNQNCWKECRVSDLEQTGGHLVRRLSGGGAVYHDLGNLNFTFCMKKNHANITRQMMVILRAAASFGLNAQMTGRNDAVIDGQKFSGNAFFDSHGCYYHHGTLLVDVDVMSMSRYLNPSREKLASRGVDSVRSRVVNLSAFCPKITVETMKQAMIRSASEVYGIPAGSFDEKRFAPEELECLRKRFDSFSWKYGRRILFTNSFGARFDWGEVELQLKVNRGVVEEALLSSDAMKAAYFQDIGPQLIGCRYEAEALAYTLDGILSNRKVPENIRLDLRNMIYGHL